jgi:transposase
VWRDNDNIPPASRFISSPYDTEAHYARKRSTQWVGYKIFLTEACDDERPHLITHVETTPGPVDDGAVTPLLHAALQQRQVLPGTHLVDTGFLDAELLATTSAQYGVDLYGPTRQDYHWQAQQSTGFAAEHFRIDWEQQHATCPAGNVSISWTLALDNRGAEVIKIKFSTKDCRHCPHLAQCVRSKKRYPRRTLTLRTETHHKALVAARQREQTEDFDREYDRRAGIEGTLSRGVRTTRLRRTRYVGLERVRLGHILTGLGLNAVRLGEWFLGMERPTSRTTPFMRLMAGAAVA